MARKAKIKINWLRFYRGKEKLSQKEVAYLMDLKSSASISRYEEGEKLPSLINALKLAIICDAPVSCLFNDLYRELKKEIQARKALLRAQQREQ
jgi:transcriptional regulator with XRE-family HTH domain